MWQYILIIAIVIAIVYFVGDFSCTCTSGKGAEQYMARMRPISGPGLYTKKYIDKDGNVREMGKKWEWPNNAPPIDIDRLSRKPWEAPAWGISGAMAGTVYRDSRFYKCGCKGPCTCANVTGNVPDEQYYTWLHGM